MNINPFMLTEKDDELLGVANRSDAMGVLAVWSSRARDLVPHLTEQTTHIQGFQILVEAFRLWERYESAHPEHAGRPDDFFLLVEQAFARIVGHHDKEWNLPGARRVKARASQEPHISLSEPDWHLLGGQKANGLWGLYRGAARRAGLLLEEMTMLSSDTMEQSTLYAGIQDTAQKRLFQLIHLAMDGATVQLPTHLNNTMPKEIHETFHHLPLASHLQTKLLNNHPLTHTLAQRLLFVETLDRRQILIETAHAHTEYQATIDNTIRCENLLSIIEALFLWLCASKGMAIKSAVQDLPVELKALERARLDFGHSGQYHGETAIARHSRFYRELDTVSHEALARSILALHQKVSDERHRAAWVWEEDGTLHSDVDIERPSALALQVGVAWRNDYYLFPLQCIARQLAKAPL